MGQPVADSKPTLVRGDVTRIARKLGLSIPHVWLCVTGQRKPGDQLAREIARVSARRAAQQQAADEDAA